jgi:hypothetical protein
MSIKLEPQWPSTYVLILQSHRLPVADIGPVWKNIYRFFGSEATVRQKEEDQYQSKESSVLVESNIEN